MDKHPSHDPWIRESVIDDPTMNVSWIFEINYFINYCDYDDYEGMTINRLDDYESMTINRPANDRDYDYNCLSLSSRFQPLSIYQ